jgi:hypothetical protein
MSRPSHTPWLHYSNYTWQRVQVIKLLVMQSSQPHVTSSLSTNTLLSTLFSNTLRLWAFPNVRDHRQNYSLIYSKFYAFVQQMRRESFWTEYLQALLEFYEYLLLLSSWIKFWFVAIVYMYLNCATFLNDVLAISVSWFSLLSGDKTAT